MPTIISRLERLEEAVTRVGDGLQSSREEYAKIIDRIDVIEVTLKSWEEYPPRTALQQGIWGNNTSR